MFTDEHRRIVWDQIRQHDLRAFAKWLSPELLTTAATEVGVRIGNGPLYVVNLAWLAVAAALHASRSFAGVLTLTLKLLADTEGFAGTPLGQERSKAKRRQSTRLRSRHDPRRRDGTVVSEEAFAKARRVLSPAYWRALLRLLAERFEAVHGCELRWKKFRLLAMDGTEIKLPCWKRLAEYFGTANNGKGKRAPQARLVMLQFPLVRWLMVEAASVHGQAPLRLSFTQTLRELQDMSPTLITASPQRVSRVLLPRLLVRIAEHLVPQRPGRHYTRPHDTKVRITGSGKRLLPSKLPTNAPRRKNTQKRAA